jgi:hypothetical protein
LEANYAGTSVDEVMVLQCDKAHVFLKIVIFALCAFEAQAHCCMKIEYYPSEVPPSFAGCPIGGQLKAANINLDGIRLIYDGKMHYVYNENLKSCFGPIAIGNEVIYGVDWDAEANSWAVTLFNRNDDHGVKVVLSKESIIIALPNK